MSRLPLADCHSTWLENDHRLGKCLLPTTTTSRSGGEAYRSALFVFFILCATAGVPLSWNKTAGGDIVTWVGFELLHRSFQLGISQRRAEWFTRWTRELSNSDFVNMTASEQGLGRVMNVVSALECERPFLAPLYKFMCLHPRGTVRRVPAYVSFLLSCLSRTVARDRHHSRDCRIATVLLFTTSPTLKRVRL